MSRTFIWAMILIVACIALVLVISMPKTPVSADTSSTDYKPMTDFLGRFYNDIAKEEAAQDLLPVSPIQQKDLAWVFKDDPDVTLKSVKGLRFANNDILILFCIETKKYVMQDLMDEIKSAPIIKDYTIVPVDSNSGNFVLNRSTDISIAGEVGYIINAKECLVIKQVISEAMKD